MFLWHLSSQNTDKRISAIRNSWDFFLPLLFQNSADDWTRDVGETLPFPIISCQVLWTCAKCYLRFLGFGWQSWNLMRSLATPAHSLRWCALWDALLLIKVAQSGTLSCCIFPVRSKQSGHSSLYCLISKVLLPADLQHTGCFSTIAVSVSKQTSQDQQFLK